MSDPAVTTGPVSPELFPEDSYGTLKRLHVLSGWLEEFRTKKGLSALSVLDFGCGTGAWLAVPLACRGYKVHGVDVHEPSIERARARNSLPDLTFGTEDVAQLIEGRAKFDVIICSEVLEHLERPAETLSQFRELLRKNGILIVTVPNGHGPFETLRRIEALLNRAGIGLLLRGAVQALRKLKRALSGKRQFSAEPASEKNVAPGYLNMESGHVQFFRLGQLVSLFKKEGFEVEEQRGRTFLCGPYADFWIDHFPSGGLLPALNNWLGDRLPMAWVSDWMFVLRKGKGASAR